MDESFKKNALDQIAALVRDNYVFPEIAEKLAEAVLKNYEQGRYSELVALSDFASAVQEDLQYISKDKHLDIWTNPQFLNELKTQSSGTSKSNQLEAARGRNFDVVEAKLFEDKTGYFRLDGFTDIKLSAEIPKFIAKTMSQFQKAKVLVFDLRENTGGDSSMVHLLSSYLFDETPVHLATVYSRKTNSEEHFWTLPNIEGKRYLDTKVFVLTSQQTFSAAEEFAYNLQNLKRAIIVGEVTGGGAHPGEFHLIQDQLALFLPSGRAINPITKTNWEGVGVKPDVEVNASEALKVALELARENSKL